MEDPKEREVALFRYSLVREPADALLTPKERGALVRALSEIEHSGPDGKRVRVARSTLDRWVRELRHGGFPALVPAARQSVPRTDASVLALAEALKREAPARTAAQVARVMSQSGTAPPSARTIQRHFARLGLTTSSERSAPRAYGRFEASRRNELWTGDALHGPVVAGRKAYLLAFIDDYSRYLVGYRWTVSEDTVRLEAAFRHGLGANGVPDAILVDNGSGYASPQLARTCAVLGVRLIHARVRTPTTKGKIERFFATMRSQFLTELEARGGAADLAELNRLFQAWVEVDYHQTVHSETRTTPAARFAEGGPPRLPSPAELHEAFLWSASRLVSKVSVVSLEGNSFEVDPALVGRRVELTFDPFDLTDVDVSYEGRPMGKAVPVKITRHVHKKAERAAPPPVVPTGIDYLSLLARRRDAELSGRRIDYAGLAARERDEGAREDDETGIAGGEER